jgi:hypothetical protein
MLAASAIASQTDAFATLMNDPEPGAIATPSLVCPVPLDIDPARDYRAGGTWASSVVRRNQFPIRLDDLVSRPLVPSARLGVGRDVLSDDEDSEGIDLISASRFGAFGSAFEDSAEYEGSAGIYF